jgi:hypothetical protein
MLYCGPDIRIRYWLVHIISLLPYVHRPMGHVEPSSLTLSVYASYGMTQKEIDNQFCAWLTVSGVSESCVVNRSKYSVLFVGPVVLEVVSIRV